MGVVFKLVFCNVMLYMSYFFGDSLPEQFSAELALPILLSIAGLFSRHTISALVMVLSETTA
jgi:hypothetical protein